MSRLWQVPRGLSGERRLLGRYHGIGSPRRGLKPGVIVNCDRKDVPGWHHHTVYLTASWLHFTGNTLDPRKPFAASQLTNYLPVNLSQTSDITESRAVFDQPFDGPG